MMALSVLGFVVFFLLFELVLLLSGYGNVARCHSRWVRYTQLIKDDAALEWQLLADYWLLLDYLSGRLPLDTFITRARQQQHRSVECHQYPENVIDWRTLL